MGEHLVDGEFKSDKYEWCPPGFVPLRTRDPDAQDLLWVYAQRRARLDAGFGADLVDALRLKGFTMADGPKDPWWVWRWDRAHVAWAVMPYARITRWRRGPLTVYRGTAAGGCSSTTWTFYGPFNLNVSFSL